MDIRANPILLRAALLVTLSIALVLGLVLLPSHDGAQGAQQKEMKNAIPAQVMRKMAQPRDSLKGGGARVSDAPTVPWPHMTRRRKASPDEIAQWLKELGDNSYKVREAATKALVEVGQPAIKGLEEATRSGDPEVRRRAENMIERIEVNEALAPTVIDLKVADMPVPEVVGLFNRQSRLKLELVPQQGPARRQMEQRKLTLDMDGVPFWEALDRVCDAAGVAVLSLTPTQAQVQLAEGSTFRAPTAYSGPFRMRVTGMNYYRNLTMVEPGQAGMQQAMQFGQPGMAMPGMGGMGMGGPQQGFLVGGQPMGQSRLVRQENLSAGMDLLGEPHLNLVSIGSPTITVAENEDGQSLAPAGSAVSNYYPQGYYGNVAGVLQVRQTQFTLQPATKPAATLKVLRGTIPVEVLVQRKALIAVDNFLTDKTKIHKGEGEVTLAILQVQDNGNGRSGSIRFFLSGVERPSNLNPNFNPGFAPAAFEITDAQGQHFQVNQNVNFANPNERNMEGNLFFNAMSPNMGAAVKLTYHSNKAVRTAVPFEFHSVPMP
ncbi:MAG TPA: HEAT repeat domain-containing protein [Gemmataceae bacterium]|nr:HEAT repeat domain-containing protein [Gemmataceae bacterium]